VHKPYSFEAKELSLVGLNLQAVINLKDLPQEIFNQLSPLTDKLTHYTQLILIGHGGQLLWKKINSSSFDSNNPIDDYSRLQTEMFFSRHFSTDDFEIIFPALTSSEKQKSIGLQKLGEIIGWHNESPFRVGINQEWGSWFAYRAVVLAKSDYLVNQNDQALSPCSQCETKPCIQACPANALVGDGLDLDQCISYRKKADSKCKGRCLARMACPVAKEHQYEIDQIQYHYSLSMRMIENIER